MRSPAETCSPCPLCGNINKQTGPQLSCLVVFNRFSQLPVLLFPLSIKPSCESRAVPFVPFTRSSHWSYSGWVKARTLFGVKRSLLAFVTEQIGLQKWHYSYLGVQVRTFLCTSILPWISFPDSPNKTFPTFFKYLSTCSPKSYFKSRGFPILAKLNHKNSPFDSDPGPFGFSCSHFAEWPSRWWASPRTLTSRDRCRAATTAAWMSRRHPAARVHRAPGWVPCPCLRTAMRGQRRMAVSVRQSTWKMVGANTKEGLENLKIQETHTAFTEHIPMPHKHSHTGKAF